MAKRDQLDNIDDSINDIAESLDCICKLIVQLGCEGEEINGKLDKLIEVLLAGPSMLSSQQRAALRNLLQDEHPHG
jgi:hypothetical protein